MIKVAVFNHKGGVGKTTISIILTQIALTNNQKVCAIDQDEQCNFYSSISYLTKEQRFKNLLTLKTVLTEKDFEDSADWLIIDCPSHFIERSRMAIKKSDIILIPVKPDTWSIEHFQEIYKNAGDYKQIFQFPIVKVGFIEGRIRYKSSAAKDASKIIADRKYRVIGDLQLYDKINSNLASSKHKLWFFGLSEQQQQPFKLLYKRLIFINNLIEGSRQKKKPEQYYGYDDDKDNSDIPQFGIHFWKDDSI